MRCEVTYSTPVVRTARVRQLEGLFDLPPSKRSEQTFAAELPIESRPWNIGLIVGPSGCGKSTLARRLFPDALVSGYDWPDDKAIVDAFPAGLPIKELTGLLSSVGFSSPPSWLRPFRCLSNGEQFRVTLARALAESPQLAVVDEFTSVVDRTVAQIGSAAVAKAVRRRNQRFIAVACHYDIVDWLDPDWTYEPATGTFQWRLERRGRPPIRLDIVRAPTDAWNLFRQHHYLTGALYPKARCFVASIAGRPAAFASTLFFPHSRAPGWREHRTVCLPDFQGVGIGNALSEFVASLYRESGKPYRSVTGNPAMIAHRQRSPLWRVVRKSSTVTPGQANGPIPALARTESSDRITASFEYVGPAAPSDLARALLGADPNRDRLGATLLPLIARHRGATVAFLARRANARPDQVRAACHALVAAGRLVRHGSGRGADAITYSPAPDRPTD